MRGFGSERWEAEVCRGSTCAACSHGQSADTRGESPPVGCASHLNRSRRARRLEMAGQVRGPGAAGRTMPTTEVTTTTAATEPSATTLLAEDAGESSAPEFRNGGQRRSEIAHAMNELRQTMRFADHNGSPNGRYADAQMSDAVERLAT